jgi:putative acetyltransferase
MVTIRPSDASDREAILAVVRDAFSNDGRDPQEEVDVVTATWARDASPEGLELVAVDQATIVGHVLAARGRLAGTDALGVAPLAVVPARQRSGIGTALMTELIARADARGWPLLLLLGGPTYYARFGFEPASGLGITYAALGGPDPHFMARRLHRYDSVLTGAFSYCWELD